jgi:hypothetical protein
VDGTLGGDGLVVGAGVVGLTAALVLLEDVVGAWLDVFRVVALGLGTPVGAAWLALGRLGRGAGFRVGRAAWVLEGLTAGSAVGRAAACCWSR